ncbi:UDP-N-acetyl-D-mannosamine dehydrogenase [Rhizobium sp. LjRoot98]|uniref:UDP-N-acetyl-D-mannosamine dehydrogenase n=1 Tax=unclassified Rhizobium TaxID=2613769 RepID=UPI000714DB27|nr:MULTISPECIES: UDP-N-acetyl-D-mannosamine dehydrogenase [unclassified Rhizobium]KQV32017.1 UDP-N-acetyl-D-mannosaminuronic acid dehydrogenase [Rhizobium sp. Root1204]KQY16673.1 UDP-N-acetyl-D-mannosaminuronic acid dehydrogenase [Rhizobium sp. Root1334]KRC11241.1 UDP-N-acetyl-D-mannosaminuronic acid dehydrogenase [Rhizobium sp. Root73]
MSDVFKSRVAILGMGYIGLPTAVAIATRGVDVIGVDINPATVAALSRGEVPFVEPDLAVAVSGAVAMGRLTATTETPEAEAFIIAVPTPFNEDRTADLSYVKAAAEQIAPRLKPGNIVVLESTSPPGTTQKVGDWIGALRPDLRMPRDGETGADIFVAHCPERVLPGRIMIEMITNDRVVGGLTPRCAEKAASIYRLFAQGEILLTDAASAEMAKLVENAYRDVNIAFANEISLISESLHIDVWEVIRLANRHPRVNILSPGPGVGGHCIPVDPWFIVSAAPQLSRLIRTAREVNDHRPHHVAGQVVEKAKRFRSPTVACLGLTFKANVDDVRESPAIEVVGLIAQALPDVEILVADPYVSAMPGLLSKYDNLHLEGAYQAVERADIVVLLVEHEPFKAMRHTRLAGKVIYDTRGAWH